MNCPVDGTTLSLSERQGVEIDYCPQCRGVWLDRGELDKLIERSSTDDTRAVYEETGPRYDDRPRYDRDDDDRPRYDRDDDDRYRYDPRHRKKKKRGWLEDVFDFD